MRRTQSKNLAKIHGVVAAQFGPQHSSVLQSVLKLTWDSIPNLLGEESKIPEIGVSLFCLKIVLTEFRFVHSVVDFRKGLKTFEPSLTFLGWNFKKPLLRGRLGSKRIQLWRFSKNRTRGVDRALSVSEWKLKQSIAIAASRWCHTQLGICNKYACYRF